jgi:hypothetical protein
MLMLGRAFSPMFKEITISTCTSIVSNQVRLDLRELLNMGIGWVQEIQALSAIHFFFLSCADKIAPLVTRYYIYYCIYSLHI